MPNKRKGNGAYNYMYFSAGLICVVVAIIIASLIAFVNFEEEDISEDVSELVSEATSEVIVSTDVSAGAQSGLLDDIRMDDLVVNNSSVFDGKLAVITNNDESYRSAEDFELVRFYGNKGSGYELSGTGVKVEKEAQERFDAFLVSFAETLPGSGVIVDKGYSDRETLIKNSLFDEFADLTSGMSVLLGLSGSDYSFSSPEFAYLYEQAYKYGIIQRYPENKESSTNHTANKKLYRYIGIAHTQYMHIYNLSLEEYLDALRSNDKPLEITSTLEQNKKYVVYYTAMSGGAGDTTIVKVPSDLPYEISGDGSGGFVVTVTIEN